jgi:hypothetical protein
MTGAAAGNGLFSGGGATLLMAQLKGVAAVGACTLVASLVFRDVIARRRRDS